MRIRRLFLGFVLVGVLADSLVEGQEAGSGGIANWAAPASWSLTRTAGVRALSDATPPLPFIGLPPCRILDTRGNGAPIQGGIFTGGSDVRSYTIPPICGVPAGVAAVSLNFTVTGPGQTAAGFLLAWPSGGAVPPVSILNWFTVPEQIANAAVVPTNGSGSITVNVSAPTHVIMDINGYYSSTLGSPQNYFFIDNNSTLFSIYSKNSSTTCHGACGVLSEVSSTHAAGAAAIWGDAYGTTGSHVGVRARTFSSSAGTYGMYGTVASTASDAAGVRGIDGSGAPAGATSRPSAGVRGESDLSVGVYGFSGNIAVVGEYVTSMGTLASGELGRASGPYGVFSVGNIGVSSGTKFFVEPHPTDASKVIRYVSLEGRESGTYFRCRAKCVDGIAVVPIPEDFAVVTDENDLSVQATAIGKLATFAVEKLDLREVVLECSRNVEVFVTVNGVRRAFKDHQPVSEGSEFRPRSATERMPAYLTEEDKRRLVGNGTYNLDGTVNLTTADRLGWTKMWADRMAQAEAAASEARKEAQKAAMNRKPSDP